LSVAAGTNHHTVIPNANSVWDLNADSVIIIAVVNGAAPGANSNIMGNSSNTAYFGVGLQAMTTGKLRPNVNADALSFGTSSTATVFDSTDHHIVVAIDGPLKIVKTYVDGALDNTLGTAYANTGNHVIAGTFNLGVNNEGVTSIAMKFKGVQILKCTGSSLPINIDQIAKMAFAKIRTGISAADPVFM
jgi:hypothetical protein